MEHFFPSPAHYKLVDGMRDAGCHALTFLINFLDFSNKSFSIHNIKKITFLTIKLVSSSCPFLF